MNESDVRTGVTQCRNPCLFVWWKECLMVVVNSPFREGLSLWMEAIS